MQQPKTNQFLVNHRKGAFGILINSVDEKNFVGLLRYHDGPVRTKGKDLSVTTFDLKGEKFFNTTPQGVLEDCTKWIVENLGKEFTMEKIESD